MTLVPLPAAKAVGDARGVPVPDDGLADHSPVHYATRIWKEYVRSLGGA